MFFCGKRRFMALKTLQWRGNNGYKFALPSERLRAIDPLVARENYIRLLGGLCPIDLTRRIRMIGILCGTREPSCPVVAAMVMGDVVGHQLCLRCTNPTVGIHKKSLCNICVSCKNILFRSKFYSGCPDSPNRIYSILYLDQV